MRGARTVVGSLRGGGCEQYSFSRAVRWKEREEQNGRLDRRWCVRAERAGRGRGEPVRGHLRAHGWGKRFRIQKRSRHSTLFGRQQSVTGRCCIHKQRLKAGRAAPHRWWHCYPCGSALCSLLVDLRYGRGERGAMSGRAGGIKMAEAPAPALRKADGMALRDSRTHLLEANLSGDLAEDAARDIEAVLADEAAAVVGDAAGQERRTQGGHGERRGVCHECTEGGARSR